MNKIIKIPENISCIDEDQELNKLKNLEKEFLKTLKKARKEIDEQLKIASDALDKAEKISEETGIPFSSCLSPLGQEYKPSSFYDKWGKLFNEYDEDDLEDGDESNDSHLLKLLDMYGIPEYEGWQHSAVC